MAQPDDDIQRAWRIHGANVAGQDLVRTWRSEGFVSLAAKFLPHVESGIGRDDLKALVRKGYAASGYAAQGDLFDEFFQFLNVISVGDLVVTVSQGRVYFGTVMGEAEQVRSPAGRSNLRRRVKWEPHSIAKDDLPPVLGGRLHAQSEVIELTGQIETIRSLMQPSIVPKPTTTVELPDPDDDFARSLHVSRDWLQECVDLLRDRPQLIFYGPPGTGKTYIAQKLAKYIAGGRDENVKIVQFHPAFSYEDFFEGYRPTKEDGRVGFDLHPGPLRALVDRAVDNPGTVYVLIIDEINRGNLAKIFGELYFLLEYRSEAIDLLYGSGSSAGFMLPENVFIIGTMNTADRSIALVDAAMRRRFAFVPLHPSELPTSDVLRSWLESEEYTLESADLLEELNRAIEDDDFKIGPSYFMRKAVQQEGGIERVWKYNILPLLEEFHYGSGLDVRSTYGLDVIRKRVETKSRDEATDITG